MSHSEREDAANHILEDWVGSMACSRGVPLSFTACCIGDHLCMIFYECGDSICWNLETGEVSTL